MMSVQWGYAIIEVNGNWPEVEKEFTRMGATGFELVTIIQHPEPEKFMSGGVSLTTNLFAFFKKPLQNTSSDRVEVRQY